MEIVKSFSLIILSLLSFIGMIAFFVTIITLPTMLLWNWLVPEIFNLRTINFFEALGLLILVNFFRMNLISFHAVNEKK